jgi:GMP synthase (glutamine-hydrolysing)
LPGARPRDQHFAGRAVHDLIERAWLNAFLACWLARTPQVPSFGTAFAQAAE